MPEITSTVVLFAPLFGNIRPGSEENGALINLGQPRYNASGCPFLGLPVPAHLIVLEINIECRSSCALQRN